MIDELQSDGEDYVLLNSWILSQPGLLKTRKELFAEFLVAILEQFLRGKNFITPRKEGRKCYF